MTATPPAFDGHNDVLLRLWKRYPRSLDDFRDGGPGHIDLPKARKGGFAGGFFAIFVPGGGAFSLDALRNPPYDVPLPEAVDEAVALKIALEQARILLDLHARGDLSLCRTAAQIRAAMDAGHVAAIMHLEGAEAIGPDLAALDVLHAAGLRSIGPVWSRPTVFGSGVPFRFPSGPDIGPGLTDAGRALVSRASELRMVVDLSHLNAAGFFDVAEMGLPLVATHSNAHALCPHARNLTDDQLHAIGQTGGMAGLNFATAFLRPDGRMVPEDALDHMARHLAHMIDLAGESHVGLGSDFDGAIVPREIANAGGLDALRDELVRAGFGSDLIERIFWRNWIETLDRIWRE